MFLAWLIFSTLFLLLIILYVSLISSADYEEVVVSYENVNKTHYVKT